MGCAPCLIRSDVTGQYTAPTTATDTSPTTVIDTINQEDIVANEGMWRGLQAPTAEPGRFSHLEKALWQFNQYILDRVYGEGS